MTPEVVCNSAVLIQKGLPWSPCSLHRPLPWGCPWQGPLPPTGGRGQEPSVTLRGWSSPEEGKLPSSGSPQPLASPPDCPPRWLSPTRIQFSSPLRFRGGPGMLSSTSFASCDFRTMASFSRTAVCIRRTLDWFLGEKTGRWAAGWGCQAPRPLPLLGTACQEGGQREGDPLPKHCRAALTDFPTPWQRERRQEQRERKEGRSCHCLWVLVPPDPPHLTH